MTIAFITSHINKSLQWYWFSEELVNRGIPHIHVIINSSQPLLQTDLNRLGVTVYYLSHTGPWAHFSNLWAICSILRKHRVKLVHTSLPYGNLLGQLAAWLGGIKQRVSTCENASWGDDFSSRKQKFIDWLTYKLARRVIAVSDTAADYLRERWKLSPEQLTTIYHGLKVADFDSIAPSRIDSLREQLGISPDDFIIGVIARLEHWKGHAYVVEAVRQIIKEHPDVKVIIVGSQGPEYGRLMSQIKQAGLEKTVFYKGFVSDPVALFQLFDIHVHVPINKYVENCGINIIEGMISERPQILTQSGYACMTARHLGNCLVVDYCNAEQIANAIVTLKRDEKLRRDLGKQARLDAIRLFSNQVKVDRHLELYRQLYGYAGPRDVRNATC